VTFSVTLKNITWKDDFMSDWIELIKEAKELGLTPNEVLAFLKGDAVETKMDH
jgi:hypothetical protein